VTLGKIQYSSPEQRTDAKSVDHRTDLYALGVMFYELLSGELPMPGVKLKSLVSWLPASGEAFVEKAMANDPEDRYQSAREFREAMMLVYDECKELERAAEGRPPKVDLAAAPTPLEGSGGLRFESGPATPSPADVPKAPKVSAPKARGLRARVRAWWGRIRGR
jgi:serine/threonine protein kinase